MLDLDPSIHLHEVEVLSGFIDKIFDGTGVLVADVFDEIDRCLAHPCTQLWREQRRRALLDNLLVAALHGAIALTKVDEIAVGVAEDLKLDVMRVDHELFKVAIAIAETGHRFVGGRVEQADEFLFLEARTHAAATTTGGGLDHYWQPDFFGLGQCRLSIWHDVGAGRNRHAVGDRGGAGRSLVAHPRDHLRGRADESDPRRFANFRKTRIFREKSIARVNCIRTRDLRCGDNAVDLEIGLLARSRTDANRLISELNMHGIDIRLGVNGDRFHIQLAAGANDAEGNFAAVGD